MPRIERITRAYRNKVLASFGVTPAHIQAENAAIDSGSAGSAAGQFKGTIEEPSSSTTSTAAAARSTPTERMEIATSVSQRSSRGEGAEAGDDYVSGPGVG